MRTFTDDDIFEVVKRKPFKKSSLKKITDELNLPYKNINAYLYSKGIGIRSEKNISVEEAVDRYVSGESWENISNDLNIVRETLIKKVRKSGYDTAYLKNIKTKSYRTDVRRKKDVSSVIDEEIYGIRWDYSNLLKQNPEKAKRLKEEILSKEGKHFAKLITGDE